jgi:hypothetical protein
MDPLETHYFSFENEVMGHKDPGGGYNEKSFFLENR